MTNDYTCIAVYNKAKDAVEAIELLQNHGITDVADVGIFGIADSRGLPAKTLRDGFVKEIKKSGDRPVFRSPSKNVTLPATMFWIPELGRLIVVGRYFAEALSQLQGITTVGPMSAFGVALSNLNVPTQLAMLCEGVLRGGGVVVIVRTSEQNVRLAREALDQTRPRGLDLVLPVEKCGAIHYDQAQ